MWFLLFIPFICFMIYVQYHRYWNVMLLQLLGREIIRDKAAPEIGDMTYRCRFDTSGGCTYEYKAIENINLKSKELFLVGNSLPDPANEFFWDASLQAWNHDEDRYRHENSKRKALKKKGWIKAALLLFVIAGSAKACPPSEDYFGTWKAAGVKGTLVFNKDYTCDLAFGGKHITGNWGFDEILCDLIITQNGKANIYRVLIVDDGGVKDGKLLHRLGLYFMGLTWDYLHSETKAQWEPPVYRKVKP